MLHPYLDAIFVIFVYMTLWFLVATAKRDNSIIDIAWGLGFVVVAWWQYVFYPHPHAFVLTLMVSLWGIRLGAYLFSRNWNTEEDWRYQEMRKNWGNNVLLNAYVRVFLLQGGLMYLISLVLQQQPANLIEPWQSLSIVGILIFGIGFFWESIADYQLQQFKANPDNKGKFMTKGLWQYCRHPNYFGEILIWWGIYLYTIPYGTWYIFIISPIVITFFLLKVSGIPFLKRKQEKSSKYQAYVEEVPNAIIPKFW
ncbi:MAG: DUF1295 domain-containing protein [Saprospiraceae bacterium]